MDFRQARSEYLHLRHAYRSGKLSPEEFEKQVNSMIIHDKGQMWMIGVKSGKWYRREGKSWVEDLPTLDPLPSTAQKPAGSDATKERLASPFLPKPNETSHEKKFRRLTTGFTIAFILLLAALAVIGGLMAAGKIGNPAASGGLFNSSDEDGVGAESETITASLAGNLIPFTENGLVYPAELSLKGFLYSDDICGTWLLREIGETLVIRKNGTVQAFSDTDGYDYSGSYSFTDDHTVQFFLGDSSAQATIWIDANVLTLQINDQTLVYDRVE